ncbi:MAG: HipA domain-containing protein [Cryobacterium sp.]|nr:HipA domain-containing protein [Cryobacterium sp.]
MATHLAKDAGLNVAGPRIHAVGERDVLLVERFDRTQQDHHRRLMVTALTILHRRASGDKRTTYPDLAHAIRARFTQPQTTLRELDSRIVFSVLVGNTDDHAKNHSAFWDGRDLTLTPAHAVSPQPRSGGEVTHAMAVAPNGDNRSRLVVFRKAASTYLPAG